MYLLNPSYIAQTDDALVTAIHHEVCAAKLSEQNRREFMSLQEKLQDEREDMARLLAEHYGIPLEEALALAREQATVTEEVKGASASGSSVSKMQLG